MCSEQGALQSFNWVAPFTTFDVFWRNYRKVVFCLKGTLPNRCYLFYSVVDINSSIAKPFQFKPVKIEKVCFDYF